MDYYIECTHGHYDLYVGGICYGSYDSCDEAYDNLLEAIDEYKRDISQFEREEEIDYESFYTNEERVRMTCNATDDEIEWLFR